MASKTFNPIRMTASSEDAAVAQALMLVGASREDVQIEVVERTTKGVTVRIAPRAENDAAASVTAVSTAVSEPSVEAALQNETPLQNAPETSQELAAEMSREIEREEEEETALEENAPAFIETPTAPREAVAEGFAVEGDENREYSRADAESAAPSSEAPPRERRPRDRDRVRDEDLQPISDADKTRVLELARLILNKMGLDAQVEIGSAPEGDQRKESRLYLDVDGEDVGILIGKNGQTLQAFQYILNVTANNGAADAVRVTVDAGGYRARRADSLEAMARDAAERAQRDKRPVRLDPMPAGERRTVHMILEKISGISTSSEGREPMRHIVVIPAGASTRGDYGGGENRESGNREGGGFRGGRSSNRGFRGGR